MFPDFSQDKYGLLHLLTTAIAQVTVSHPRDTKVIFLALPKSSEVTLMCHKKVIHLFCHQQGCIAA